MSSTAMVALLRASLTFICGAALLGLSSVSALAGSAQTESAGTLQAVAADEPLREGSLAVTGASTVLKIPIPAVQTAPLSGLQPIPSAAAPQLLPASTVGALPAKVAPGLTDLAAPSAGVGAAATKISAVASATAPNPGASVASAVQSQIEAIELLSPVQRNRYQRAASLFADFCQDWQRLLHEREVDNLGHLSWREQGGFETATYTGYGKLESCECKASKEGLPIGKIRYEEIDYSLAGKTIDEAEHATPKLMGEISTLEIFSWDQDKWFY